MKQIPLSHGKFALVNDEDFEELSRYRWFAKKCSGRFYAARTEWDKHQVCKTIYMHRMILNASARKIHVDHKDGNGLNNQRQNIRLCSCAENLRNQRISKRNSSGIKGVSWDKNNEKWRATIRVSGIQKTIGRFKNIEEAAMAREEAARHYFGEFNNVFLEQ